VSEIERYRPTMSGELLQLWAVDAQAEIDRLNEEINRLRQYEDAVTSAVRGELMVYNLQDTNCTVIRHSYWVAHIEEIEKLKAELERFKQGVEVEGVIEYYPGTKIAGVFVHQKMPDEQVGQHVRVLVRAKEEVCK